MWVYDMAKAQTKKLNHEYKTIGYEEIILYSSVRSIMMFQFKIFTIFTIEDNRLSSFQYMRIETINSCEILVWFVSRAFY